MTIGSASTRYGSTSVLLLFLAFISSRASAHAHLTFLLSVDTSARHSSVGDSTLANSRSEPKKTHFGINKNYLSRLGHRKGEIYFTWGYNRSAYTHSDINFSGAGYNFTLYHVVAKDAPTPFGLNPYLNPSTITIPQFNFRLGYYFRDKYSLSVGWDHMKYVMVANQVVNITGAIAAEVSKPSIPTGGYQGTYDQTPLVVAPDFLTFEHTDGLNYASVELDRIENVWTAGNGKTGLSFTSGVGLGGVVPRSDVRLFTVGKNNYWNLAGFGASLKFGLKFDLTRNLFMEGNLKGGYIDLVHIRTTGRTGDSARQHFQFIEGFIVVGYKFSTAKK